MHVSLLSLGSRGDVEPFIALGLALGGRGHKVHIGAPESLRGLVEEAGIEFRPIPGEPDDFFGNQKVVDSLRQSPSMARLAKAMDKPPTDLLAMAFTAMAEVANDADLTVNSMVARAASLAIPGAPWITTSWWPITPTSQAPAMIFPKLPLGGLYNRLTHAMANGLDWKMNRPVVNACRSGAGLPALKKSPMREVGHSRPILYPFSPSLVDTPRDWPAGAHITGYWHREPHWAPQEELVSFLKDGSAPVVASFGTMWLVHRQEQTLKHLVSATRAAGRRLIVIGGPEENVPDDVLRLTNVSFDWLLPQAAALIHHGGLGTTAAGLRAGIPHVVVPTYADQPYWAARVADKKVGGPTVPFAKLSAELLTASLKTAVGDPSIAENAKRLGAAIRAENGAERACDVIERWADSQ